MINVAYAIDVQGNGAIPFINQLKVSIYSMFKNKNEDDVISIYILYNNITAEFMQEINNLNNVNFVIRFIKLKPSDVNYMQQFTLQQPNSSSRAWSGIVYTRLWLANLLPNLDRVIYLDSDTFVRGSLSELYEYDLEGKSYGLVMGCIPEYGYNSGVILMDLNKIRQNNKWKDLEDHLKKHSIKYFLPDQTTINRFYKDDIKELPLKFNYPPVTNLMGTKECQEAIIWHFYNGGTKPLMFSESDWCKVVWNNFLKEISPK